MRICYNVSAMIANNALNRNDDKLTQSLKRLSSGLKVVEAKDNPAGMAMGKRMNAQIKGISVATQNSSDAISVIETADGALSEVHSILQRMNELSIRAST
ncbi:MAG: flagellin FliC3, partial [Kineothrix sp.]